MAEAAGFDDVGDAAEAAQEFAELFEIAHPDLQVDRHLVQGLVQAAADVGDLGFRGREYR